MIRHPAFPYVAPFAAFMLMLVINSLDSRAIYITYPIMVLGVGLLIACHLRKLPPLFPNRAPASIGLGLLGAVLWVGLYPWLSSVKPDSVPGFNPSLFEDRDIRWGLLFFRMFGFSLIVPIMEEIFWRGFLMRCLIKDDFESVRLGTYTHLSFWATTGLFVAAHTDEWGVALLWGTMAGGWFVHTKNLGNIILLHAVTNFTLGIYVLATEKWYFW